MLGRLAFVNQPRKVRGPQVRKCATAAHAGSWSRSTCTSPAGQSVTGLALVSALWARYCAGVSDSGKPIPPNDPSWERLTAQAQTARHAPAAWLEMGDIFGPLASHPAYVAAFTTALSSLWARGTQATLQAYLADRL